MEDYKQEIISSRCGCLGSSDAKMLAGIATMGYVPQSAKKRLAVCKGLIVSVTPTTRAMQYGDYIENMVFESLHSKDERWQSNPCLESDKYSRKNVKCIDHVDFLLVDDKAKVVTIGECKASKLTTAEVRNEYKAQLAHHRLMGEDFCKSLGKGYKLRLILCHYNMDGVDIDAPFTFDPDRLTVQSLKAASLNYDLAKAMDIVDDYLETLDAYYEGDEINASYLPDKVRDEFQSITRVLSEIKEREAKVEDFKARLTDFMQSHGIKSIKSDDWSLIFIAPSQSVSVDYKTMAEKELFEGHPTKARRLRETYKKTINKKAFVRIDLKKDK